jgi:hypothetical protein
MPAVAQTSSEVNPQTPVEDFERSAYSPSGAIPVLRWRPR